MDDLTARTADATLPAYENPLGVDGFEFVEFTGPDPQAMIKQIEVMGFVQTHVNPKNGVVRMKQGDITFLVHTKPEGHAGEFARDHGPSANGMAFRVNDAKKAYDAAVARGAHPADMHDGGALGEGAYVLRGIGGSLLYIIDAYGEGGSLYDAWDEIEGWEEAERKNNVGLHLLDHLTHNVKRGQMRTWSGFYNDDVRLRGAEVFRHQGQGDGPLLPGHDRPRPRHPHPPEREPGRQLPDRGVPASLQRRGHPAHRPGHRQHLRDGRGHEAPRRRLPGHHRDLFRADRQTPAQPRRGRGTDAQEPHPDRWL